jgi:hypothetical protein
MSASDWFQGTKTAVRDLVHSLTLLKKQCRKLGWERLELQVNSALRGIRHETEHEAILALVGELEKALLYECNRHVFFVLPEKYRGLVEHWPGQVPFGPEVRHRFARSCVNIDAASRCFAFGLPTACVFHLMGVIQEGINAVATDLGVPVLLTSTWEEIIGKLDGHLDVKRTAMGKVAWKRIEPFYSEALSDLRSVKNAWRNPTMHFNRSYSEDEAKKCFDRTEMFMAHIATRLRQAPAPK